MGFPSRSAWLACISAKELEELRFFSMIEPLGLDREDVHAAAISMNDVKSDSFKYKPPISEEQARKDFFNDDDFDLE